MAKARRKSKSVVKKGKGKVIQYDSLTFLLFLVFVLLVSVLLVARVFGVY